MSVAELAKYSQWVVTYTVDKIPLNANNGKHAAVDNPATWTTYDVAAAACAQDKFLVLGFVITSNDPFVCIDLDTYKSNDPAVIELHKSIYESLDSYSELSPSGGVHIWTKGKLAAGKRDSKNCWEVYAESRYITVTGNIINDKPIEERQSKLEELIGRIHAPIQTAWIGGDQTKSDEEICRMAASATNGDLFKMLWYGNWADANYPSQSEGDLAFLNIVAFYTDNKEQVARVYYNSLLFQNSPKKKRKAKHDYLFHANYGLITKAFDQKNYFPELEAIVKAKVDETARQAIIKPIESPSPGEQVKEELINNLPGFIKEPLKDFSFDQLPPGLIGEMAQFIYQNAVRPVKEIAIAAAIGYMAGICGKGWNVSKTGLNHYIVILAPTAGGKEGAASGMEQLTTAVSEKFPAFEQFIGPAEIASPQALVKHLSMVSPCFISHKGEVGFWMQKLTNRWAKSNEITLRALLLDLFTKSGYGQVVRGSIYSDKTKDVKPIHAPAFTLFGDATPDTFYKALDEENIEEGLVARFTVVEATGERTEFNNNHGELKPNPMMIDKLAGIARKAMQLSQVNTVIQVQETQEAHFEQMKFNTECYERALEDRDSAEGKLYSRAHLRLLRLAALVAVGINPDVPVMTAECVHWAKAFIVHGIAAIVARFEAGRIGDINYTLEQRILIKKCLQNYLGKGYQDSFVKNYGIDVAMYNAHIVTNRYVQLSVTKHVAFRKDRNSMMAYKNMIQEFIDNGIIEKIDLGKIKDSARRGIAYYIRDLR